MNQINKIKHIYTKNKHFIIKSLSSRNNTIKSAITSRTSLIIGTSLFGVGCISYCIINKNILFDNLKKFSSINLFADKGKIEQDSLRDVKEDLCNSAEVKKATGDDSHDTGHDLIHPVSLPSTIPYLIIGAGVAGMSAARTIRASDPFAKVLIINSECQSPGEHRDIYPPYRRLLLSKFIWRKTKENHIKLFDTSGDVKSNSLLFIEPESFFVPLENLSQLEYGGISLLNNTKVSSIDPQESSVILEGSGHKITYKACLIATGSYPRRLRHLETSNNTDTDFYKSGKVSYFRGLNDFRNLFENIKRIQNRENGGRILIVGSGLLGTELTSHLGRLAKDEGKLEVVEVFKEKSHLYNLLPEDLSLYLYKNIARTNTKLISQSKVIGIGEISDDGPDKGRLNITIKSLSESQLNQECQEIVDHVVIAAGVKPDISLAHNSNLETDHLLGGFIVNAELEARNGVFIAGDVCSFYDPLLGRRRVEHWDHAEESGSIAGHNMATFVLKNYHPDSLARIDRSKLAVDILKPKIYEQQSSFSFKLTLYKTIEAIGLIDSTLDTRTFIAQDFFDEIDLEDENKEGKALETVKKITKDKLDMPGVVFYLRNQRIVGILMWNCDDDIIIDSDFPSPLRTNVARKILSERRLILSDNELRTLAAEFDLSFYVNSQIKFLDKYSKKRREEEEMDSKKEIDSQKDKI